MKRSRLDFINLKKEFNVLKENMGFSWGALRSAKLDQKCTECAKSVGSQYDQPNPNCKTCMGIGYAYIDNLIKLRTSDRSSAKKFLFELGSVNTSNRDFFLESKLRPKEYDFILELHLDELTGSPIQPFKIRSVYKIQDVYQARGAGGATSYWHCLAETRNFTAGKNLAPAAKPPLQEATEFAAEVLYGLSLEDSSGGSTAIVMSSLYTFNYCDILNVDRQLVLTPASSPPEGQLLYSDINGIDRSVLLLPVSDIPVIGPGQL
jgi:hypothetical protein